MAKSTGAFHSLTPPARRILLGNGISSVGTGLTFTFLVIYLGEVRGLGTLTAGLIVAYMAVIGLVCGIAVGPIVDRFGPRPVLMVGLVVISIGVESLTLVATVPSALAAATIISIGNATFWAPQAALYARVTPHDKRQDVFGLQFMVLNLGLGIGGLIAATIIKVDQPTTFTILYLIDAATFLVYAAILVPMRGVGTGRAVDVDDTPRSSSGGYRQVLADRALLRIALGSVVLLTFGYGSLEVGLPTITTIIGGLSPSVVAVAYAINTAVIVVLQIFVLRLVRGRSRTRAAFVVGLLWASAWILTGISIGFTPIVAAVCICVGVAVFALGECIWSPVAPAMVNDLAPDSLRGRYNAVISWTWNASNALGPAIAAVLLGAGEATWWVLLVASGCLVGGYLLLRARTLLTPAQDGRDVPYSR